MKRDRGEVLERLAMVQLEYGAVSRERLRLFAELDSYENWQELGARNAAHYICMNYGMTEWKAKRLIACAYALEGLPGIERAVSAGVLSVDKAMELTRFASRENEGDLVRWANTVSSVTIRQRGDKLERRAREQVQKAHQERSYDSFYYRDEDGSDRFQAQIDVPAAEGPAIDASVNSTAAKIPELPGEEGASGMKARRADAAVALLQGKGEKGVKTEVVVFAHLSELEQEDGTAEVMGGPVIPAAEARQLLCASSFRTLLLSDDGAPLKMGKSRRFHTRNQEKALWVRDGGCTFPVCGTKRYVEVHHSPPYDPGGRTDVDAMGLACSFHHDLEHKYGWKMAVVGGKVRWYTPEGKRYLGGPAPPGDRLDEAS